MTLTHDSSTVFFTMAFAMTSMKTNYITEGGFMPTVKIQGQVVHQLGPLLPEDDEEAKFVQIYFIGKQPN